jgi:hypothetical protein
MYDVLNLCIVSDVSNLPVWTLVYKSKPNASIKPAWWNVALFLPSTLWGGWLAWRESPHQQHCVRAVIRWWKRLRCGAGSRALGSVITCQAEGHHQFVWPLAPSKSEWVSTALMPRLAYSSRLLFNRSDLKRGFKNRKRWTRTGKGNLCLGGCFSELNFFF